MALKNVNTYACINATSNSKKFMKMTKMTERGEIAKPNAVSEAPSTKIKLTNPSMIMWPAVMLANNLSVNTTGFTNTPTNSITGISGIGNFNQTGTPGVLKMCFQ